MEKRPLRTITPPFVVAEPTGVVIHDRLKHLTPEDEQVLWEVGTYLASLAGQDLRRQCQDGLNSDKHSWAERYHALAPVSSSRWSNTITRHTHVQWALARRGQQQRIDKLKAAIAMLEHRLSLPLHAKGTRHEPGGYRSRHEWWTKSRRLATLKDHLANLDKDRVAGRVSIVRGGKRLAKNRHNLEAAGLSGSEWRMKWGATRLFLQATGANDRRFGNETIRVTDAGQLSLRLPTPLSHLANAPHNRGGTGGSAQRSAASRLRN